MYKAIDDVRTRGDSCGGEVTCVIRHCPVGLGAPVFDKLEADLAKAMMSLPASKGFEIGSGFAGARMVGSEHNDAFFLDARGRVRTRTNRSGGVQGGLSNGEPIVLRVAFKPTSTIARTQKTVDARGAGGRPARARPARPLRRAAGGRDGRGDGRARARRPPARALCAVRAAPEVGGRGGARPEGGEPVQGGGDGRLKGGGGGRSFCGGGGGAFSFLFCFSFFLFFCALGSPLFVSILFPVATGKELRRIVLPCLFFLLCVNQLPHLSSSAGAGRDEKREGERGRGRETEREKTAERDCSEKPERLLLSFQNK